MTNIDEYGTKKWYKHGKLHREDGPAIEYHDGNKEWYINDILHREDGPAIITQDGYSFWYNHGVPHRLDGPAKIYSDGTKLWFINNIPINDEIYPWAKNNDIDLDNLTDVDKVLIKLTWADYGN